MTMKSVLIEAIEVEHPPWKAHSLKRDDELVVGLTPILCLHF